GLGGYLLAPRGGPEAALAVLLARPGARVVQFRAEGARGELALAFAPGVGRSFLLGTSLEAPPQGRVYQLWMIVDGSPVSGGLFTPRDGTVLVELPADPSSAQAVAVTVEPPGGSRRPSSPPVFQAPLQSV
ncbi:MAG TPA: anti-sigma factor, partial [Actinomycetota bacterium]|nr:anti-sigma factor [Actinomycetota bacterium]